jgi:hypothetical protein
MIEVSIGIDRDLYFINGGKMRSILEYKWSCIIGKMRSILNMFKSHFNYTNT